MFSLKIVSSLEKILPKRECNAPEKTEFTGLQGEVLSFQAAFATDECKAYRFEIITDNQTKVETYFVENIPVEYPTFASALEDTNYISHEPGLYPDRLILVDRDWVQVTDIYKALWFSVNAQSGRHIVKVVIKSLDGVTVAEKEISINVIPATLPKQKLIYTQWFHTDCISEYYGFKSYSEDHWQMIEKFLRLAKENGINMILTPIFSPPLDTEIGRKRPTSQLLIIEKNGNEYSFDFSRVERWITLCKEIGFIHFEIPPLFTQWGARYTPRIIAIENGEEKDIFGWDVRSDDEKYDIFLSQMLPRLRAFLEKMKVANKTYFHISDEPSLEHLESYGKARKVAEKYLTDCKIIDALSDYDFYRNGVAKIPVPSTDKIKSFMDADLSEKWCYYCCVQCVGVSNRFVVMPSARNRSIGIQLYKYKADGFLHWGYNFYYSQYARLQLNPFAQTDAYNAFPSGDSIGAYPCKEGPAPAIGLKVFNEALQDLRALQLLEKYIGYDETIKLVEDTLNTVVNFDSCYSAEQILNLREIVNKRIEGMASL